MVLVFWSRTCCPGHDPSYTINSIFDDAMLNNTAKTVQIVRGGSSTVPTSARVYLHFLATFSYFVDFAQIFRVSDLYSLTLARDFMGTFAENPCSLSVPLCFRFMQLYTFIPASCPVQPQSSTLGQCHVPLRRIFLTSPGTLKKNIQI